MAPTGGAPGLTKVAERSDRCCAAVVLAPGAAPLTLTAISEHCRPEGPATQRLGRRPAWQFAVWYSLNSPAARRRLATLEPVGLARRVAGTRSGGRIVMMYAAPFSGPDLERRTRQYGYSTGRWGARQPRTAALTGSIASRLHGAGLRLEDMRAAGVLDDGGIASCHSGV
jgi:hypothetical protein